jgi:hypothetical protein
MNLALDFGKEPMSYTLQEIHEEFEFYENLRIIDDHWIFCFESEILSHFSLKSTILTLL